MKGLSLNTIVHGEVINNGTKRKINRRSAGDSEEMFRKKDYADRIKADALHPISDDE